MKTTKLLTVALISSGAFAFIAGCDEKPTDAPKPVPNSSVDAPAVPSMTPTTAPSTSVTPTTGPSAADTTNTPSMGTGGIAPVTPPVAPATPVAPSTQPGKSQSSTGTGSGNESRIGNAIDTGAVGASVPIDTDAGFVPPTREEKTGRP